MGYEMPDRPAFLERALQGLAFWIGHRHSLYSHYPLPEGAMVAEACNLIQANLPDNLLLRPERQYRNLLNNNTQLEGYGAHARADLVIFSAEAKKHADAKAWRHVHFVIEVKRGSASKASINDDLNRLYKFLCATETNARCFLILVSESKAPNRFVLDGKSRLHTHDIPNCNGCYHVRRTVKASASFSRKNSAHYVCLLEVFRDRPRPLPLI